MSANRNRKPTKEVGYRFARVGYGEHISETIIAVLPDHHRTDALRWRKAEARGIIVRTRSQLARAFRWCRQQGFHPKKGHTPFSSLVAWLIVEATYDRIEIPSGKEVARV